MKTPTRHGGMTCEQVAYVLRISPEMVRVIEERALAKLRLLLTQQQEWPCKDVHVPALLKRELKIDDVADQPR